MSKPQQNRTMTPKQREELLSKLKPLLNRGDYKTALMLTKSNLQKFPDDFTARYQYAKLLGDWADELPGARQLKYKKQAVEILKPLLKRLRGRPVDERFGLCLNYYYQSQNWRGMISFAKRFARMNKQKSLYAQSLGATLLAADLREQNKRSSSRTWAWKAVRSWSRYDFKNESYYFPHYSFAKALALTGESRAALDRLKIAARLGKRKVTDWEFADVVQICEIDHSGATKKS